MIASISVAIPGQGAVAGSPRQNAWIECPAKEAALVRIALEGMAQQVAVADRRGFKAGYQVVYVHST